MIRKSFLPALVVGLLVWAAPSAASTISFSAPEQLTSGPGSWMVRAADLNGDGKADLVVANALATGPGGASILMNTAPREASRASFRQCPALSTGGVSQQALTVADVTGDGKPDVIVGNFFTDGGLGGPGIQVFVNTTSNGSACPSFAAPVDVDAGAGPEVVQVGDLNGDGRPDIAFTDYGIPFVSPTQDVSVVMNEGVRGGRVQFSRRFSWHTGNAPLGLALADVNGGGKLDLVVGNNFSADVSVLMNHTAIGASAPSFSAPVDFSAGSAPIGPETLAAGRLTSDGKPDIITPNCASEHGMTVLANTTAHDAAVPSFATAGQFDPGMCPQMVALGDFTGDGRYDVAVAVQGTVSIGNQATLGAGGLLKVLSPLGSIPWLGNFSAGPSSGVMIYPNLTPRGASKPVLGAPIHFDAGAGSDALTVADFNGDGKPDLAIANNLTVGPGGVSALINQTPWRPAHHRRARSHHHHALKASE